MSYSTSTTCATTVGAAPALFASAINFLAATQCFLPDKFEPYDGDHETYDFIIVGGGAAGSVVASRLSEINDWKILLLEAGPEAPIEADIPFMTSTLQRTKYDWQYSTQNDGVSHQAIKTGNVYWPRGKMLGGSTAINAMIYTRGRDHDFQAWVNAGNPSWTPQNVNYYYRKSESFQNVELLNDLNVRQTYGHHGPLVVNKFNSTYRSVTEKVLESWDYMGLKHVPDINAAKFEGLGISGIFSATAGNGRRYSTYTAYLDPIKNKKNLKIVTNAFVTKVLINNANYAYGVEVDIFGEKKTFYSNMEVIISGGTINTPQLLMLSGIGPREHLSSRNISCLVNLPGVGKNLHDHISVPITVYGDEPGEETQPDQMFEAIKYMYNKSGLFAQNSFSDVTAFFSRNKSMEYPEFQTHLGIIWKNSTTFEKYFSGYLDEVEKSFLEASQNRSLYAFAMHNLHPSSRGSVSLNSSNPYDHPIINANYFGNAADLETIVEGIKMFTKIVKTPYFKSINAIIPRVNIQECNRYEFESDDYWKCYVINTSGTVYHPVGTAKMGPNPKDSVVNNFLKVHGVRRLRVVDASVMPSITSGNTMAPAIMIGEMASDMIKAEYLKS